MTVSDRLDFAALEDHLASFHGISPAVLRRCRYLVDLEDHHDDVAPDCGWGER